MRDRVLLLLEVEFSISMELIEGIYSSMEVIENLGIIINKRIF